MARPKFFPALVLIVSLVVVGFFVGGLGGALLASGMGFDRLADVLGGVMIGTVVGLVLGVALAVGLGVAALRRAAWVAGVAALLCLAGGYLRYQWMQDERATDPQEQTPGPTTQPAPTQ